VGVRISIKGYMHTLMCKLLLCMYTLFQAIRLSHWWPSKLLSSRINAMQPAGCISILNKEARVPTKCWVLIYQTTWCHIPKDSILQNSIYSNLTYTNMFRIQLSYNRYWICEMYMCVWVCKCTLHFSHSNTELIFAFNLFPAIAHYF
jgi:hypothetical protein